jgi:hypothetical protein
MKQQFLSSALAVALAFGPVLPVAHAATYSNGEAVSNWAEMNALFSRFIARPCRYLLTRCPWRSADKWFG